MRFGRNGKWTTRSYLFLTLPIVNVNLTVTTFIFWTLGCLDAGEKHYKFGFVTLLPWCFFIFDLIVMYPLVHKTPLLLHIRQYYSDKSDWVIPFSQYAKNGDPVIKIFKVPVQPILVWRGITATFFQHSAHGVCALQRQLSLSQFLENIHSD